MPVTLSTPDLAAASDSGASDSDNITKVATPILTGVGAEAGATITLHDSDGTTVLGTAVATAAGNWTITASKLADGIHTLSATQTTLSEGSSKASTALHGTIDNGL